jgi:hypothetical protein
MYCLSLRCISKSNIDWPCHLKGQSRFHIHSNKLFKGIINKKGTCSKSSDDDDDDDAYFVLNQYIEEDQSSMTKVTSAS